MALAGPAALAARIDLIANVRTISDIAQEWLLDRGLHSLARREPTVRARETMRRLGARRPVVYTRTGPDHGDRATPLYDAGATARFVLRHWERNAARGAAQADLAAGRTAALERFAGRLTDDGLDPVRAGITDAFSSSATSLFSSQRTAIVEALTAGGRPVIRTPVRTRRCTRRARCGAGSRAHARLPDGHLLSVYQPSGAPR